MRRAWATLTTYGFPPRMSRIRKIIAPLVFQVLPRKPFSPANTYRVKVSLLSGHGGSVSPLQYFPTHLSPNVICTWVGFRVLCHKRGWVYSLVISRNLYRLESNRCGIFSFFSRSPYFENWLWDSAHPLVTGFRGLGIPIGKIPTYTSRGCLQVFGLQSVAWPSSHHGRAVVIRHGDAHLNFPWPPSRPCHLHLKGHHRAGLAVDWSLLGRVSPFFIPGNDSNPSFL